LPHLEEVYFAGGEPLMMEEHYRLLDLLLERGRADVALSYNTNLSVLAYKGRDVRDLWDKFSKVRVSASIDAVGARGELMRKEQNWQETIENARQVRSKCPHVDFRIETTVSIFNVLHLPALFHELVALDIAPLGSLRTHVLQDPPFYAIRILPPAWKARVRAALAELEQWFAAQAAAMPDGEAALARHRTQLHDVVSYMDSEDGSDLLQTFRRSTSRLDALRSEKTREVFPELAPLLDEKEHNAGRSYWRSLEALFRRS
jgi:MoaA/NifB/PqqE/SkfB family radical SAM enzyme